MSALRRLDPDLHLQYGGRQGGVEERLAAQHSIPFVSIAGRPVSGGARAARALVSLASGVAQARRVLSAEQPDVVLSTGGYASTALATAQALRRRPLVIVEGNALPGRTNRFLGRWATLVCTAFESCQRHFPGVITVRTGFPVRADMLQKHSASQSRKAFGLDPERFALLVTGGSQGAAFFNQLVADCAHRLIAEGVQILHQTGSKDQDFQPPEQDGWVCRTHIEDMAQAYAAADVVLSRCGASTLSELAIQGAAAILTPYPFAQADHQTYNARELTDAGRAIFMAQPDLTSGAFAETVLALKEDGARRSHLVEKLKEWARPDAAKDVAGLTLQAASGGIAGGG